jgi:hypothetical protein
MRNVLCAGMIHTPPFRVKDSGKFFDKYVLAIESGMGRVIAKLEACLYENVQSLDRIYLEGLMYPRSISRDDLECEDSFSKHLYRVSDHYGIDIVGMDDSLLYDAQLFFHRLSFSKYDPLESFSDLMSNALNVRRTEKFARNIEEDISKGETCIAYYGYAHEGVIDLLSSLKQDIYTVRASPNIKIVTNGLVVESLLRELIPKIESPDVFIGDLLAEESVDDFYTDLAPKLKAL